MTPTLEFDTVRTTGNVRRAARLAVLTHQAVWHIEQTDAAAAKVEQAVAEFAEAATQANRPMRHR
jgi:hypothetical protein